MNLISYIIAAVIAVLFFLAVRYTHRHGTCEYCGANGCSGCGGGCSATDQTEAKHCCSAEVKE